MVERVIDGCRRELTRRKERRKTEGKRKRKERACQEGKYRDDLKPRNGAGAMQDAVIAQEEAEAAATVRQ